MPVWTYVALALSIVPIVLLFGFVGCGLDSTGTGPPLEPPTPYHTAIEQTADLVAYWPLGEPQGTTAHDAVGPPPDGSHPGTYNTWIAPEGFETAAAAGVIMYGRPGLIPNDPSRTSIFVDGGYVEVPFADVLNTTQFTLELIVGTGWDESMVAAYRTVFASREVVDVNIRGLILYANPMNQWEARLGLDTATPAAAVADDPPILLGSTDFLAVTYDGTTLALYVNGDLRASVDPGTAYAPNSSRPLYIGAREDDAGTTPVLPFQGQLQEVAYYSRALTHDEILEHIKASAGE